MAYLDAYERNGEAFLLDAAREVGECLVRGQLRRGGWASHIDFDPEKRGKSDYRNEQPQFPTKQIDISTSIGVSAVDFCRMFDMLETPRTRSAANRQADAAPLAG